MNKLNIPKTIHVGYQERKDTYTGQLAYVIYTDEKGKKRKEGSWESWRDKKIEAKDFDNEPTEGFVLNRNGGGGRGWDSRNEFIRVYDPRGHEFEISLANLLFILQECTSTKGKGLEGTFVYAWDGPNLILMPTSCAEYRASKEFTSLKTMKVTKNEMVEGGTYKTKNEDILMYLGRHECEPFNDWASNYYNHTLSKPPTKKYHVFWNIDKKEYVFEKGFTKLAIVIDSNVSSEYANILTDFYASKHVSMYKGLKFVPIKKPKIEGTCNWSSTKLFLIKESDEYYRVCALYRKQPYYCGNKRPSMLLHKDDLDVFAQTNHSYHNLYYMTLEEFENNPHKHDLYTLMYELESGTLLEVNRFEERQTD